MPRVRVISRAYSLDPMLHRQDTNPTVTTPIASLDSGLIFDRSITWFGRPSQQTLEPRLFYTYIPFRDQSDLPNFDSALAELNYAQLFAENIYSGYDRVAEANQLTLALNNNSPVRATTYANPRYASEIPYAGVVQKVLPIASPPFPAFPGSKEAERIFLEESVAAITGQKPVQRAMDDAAAGIERVLRREGLR